MKLRNKIFMVSWHLMRQQLNLAFDLISHPISLKELSH